MNRKLASFQRIVSLTPIPDADKIDRARVLGWDVVVRKGEFKEGDLCVFFEIDSVLPFNPFKPEEKDFKMRLKTVKMKKQLSQGLALTVDTVRPWLGETVAVEGDDLTEILKITKYEPEIFCKGSNAIGARPWWVYKTDETRVQSVPWVIDHMKGRDIYVTRKMDGSSMTVANHPEFGPVICSRNMSLQIDDAGDFVRIGKPILERLPVGFGVQGELVGPGIQKNRMGAKMHEFHVFNVWQFTDAAPRLLGVDAMQMFCDAHELTHVPILMRGPFRWESVDHILEAAVGNYDNGHPHEGIVIRPAIPELSTQLEGLLSFKAINNAYLLKTGE